MQLDPTESYSWVKVYRLTRNRQWEDMKPAGRGADQLRILESQAAQRGGITTSIVYRTFTPGSTAVRTMT